VEDARGASRRRSTRETEAAFLANCLRRQKVHESFGDTLMKVTCLLHSSEDVYRVPGARARWCVVEHGTPPRCQDWSLFNAGSGFSRLYLHFTSALEHQISICSVSAAFKNVFGAFNEPPYTTVKRSCCIGLHLCIAASRPSNLLPFKQSIQRAQHAVYSLSRNVPAIHAGILHTRRNCIQ
jgi:hypothetical protein